VNKILDVKLTASQNCIINILRKRLHNHNNILLIEKTVDWEEVVSFCIRQRILLICYNIFKSAPDQIPKDILSKCKTLYHQNSIRVIRLSKELIQVNRALSTVNIQSILMKGIGLSQILYNDFAVRPCGDIDLLVQPKDLSSVHKILFQRGYIDLLDWHPLRKKIYQYYSHHYQFYHPQKMIILELHRRYIAPSRSAHYDISGIWKRTKQINVLNENVQVMGDEDLLLYLIVHNSKELWWSLLHLYDIASLILVRPKLDWEFIIAEAESGRCIKRMLLTLILIEQIFEVQLPREIAKYMQNKSTDKSVLRVVCNKYFQPSVKMSSLWSLNIWIDLNLADTLIDKIKILSYTAFNQLIKVLEFPSIFKNMSPIL